MSVIKLLSRKMFKQNSSWQTPETVSIVYKKLAKQNLLKTRFLTDICKKGHYLH